MSEVPHWRVVQEVQAALRELKAQAALLEVPVDPIWARRLAETCAWADLSPDPSTQNAAMLCAPGGESYPGTLAVNEFPVGVKYTPERWERPLKYSVIEHAERNTLFAAARMGMATGGLTLVCPWAACPDCARAIIQCGIARLVTLTPVTADTPDRWAGSIDIAMTMLDEAGVEIIYVPGPLNLGFTIRRDGKPFAP